MLRLILEFELFSGKKNVRVQVSTLEDLTAKFQEVLGLTGQSITVSLWQADLAEWVDVTPLQDFEMDKAKVRVQIDSPLPEAHGIRDGSSPVLMQSMVYLPNLLLTPQSVLLPPQHHRYRRSHVSNCRLGGRTEGAVVALSANC